MAEMTDNEKQISDDDTFQTSVDAARAFVAAYLEKRKTENAFGLAASLFLKSLEPSDWEAALNLPAVIDGHLIRWSDGEDRELVIERCYFAEPTGYSEPTA